MTMSIPEIVDRIGDLKANIVELEKTLDEYRDELAIYGPDLYGGTLHDVRLSLVDRVTVDVDQLRLILTAEQLARISKTSRHLRMTVYGKTEGPARIAA